MTIQEITFEEVEFITHSQHRPIYAEFIQAQWRVTLEPDGL